jgi:hypothetical protein
MKTQFQSTQSRAPKPVRPDEVVGKVGDGILQIDADRAAGYAGLITLRTAKDTALARRAKLYSAKYGADDPRVARAQQERDHNTQLQQELAIAHAAAATPVPDIDDQTYVLHGFVRDQDRNPVPNLTVALYDQNGRCLPSIDDSPTDETGHFEARYAIGGTTEHRGAKSSAPKSESSEKAAREKAAHGTPSKWSTPVHDPKSSTGHVTAGSGSQQSKRAYEIRVYDAEQKVVYRDANRLHLRPGVIEYREITVDRSKCACDEAPACNETPEPQKPTQSARSTATPKKTSKAAPARRQVKPKSKRK